MSIFWQFSSLTSSIYWQIQYKTKKLNTNISWKPYVRFPSNKNYIDRCTQSDMMNLFKWSYSQFLFSWNIVSNLLKRHARPSRGLLRVGRLLDAPYVLCCYFWMLHADCSIQLFFFCLIGLTLLDCNTVLLNLVFIQFAKFTLVLMPGKNRELRNLVPRKFWQKEIHKEMEGNWAILEGSFYWFPGKCTFFLSHACPVSIILQGMK